MTTIINDPDHDPYWNNSEYTLVLDRDTMAGPNHIFYENKKIYEKKLDLLAQIGQIFYAIILTLAIVPMVCDPDYFHKVWRDAADGVERQVVILKNDNYESENNIEYGIHEMQLVIFSNVQKLAENYANTGRNNIYLDEL